MSTAFLLVHGILWAGVFAVIGLFTQMRLNPRYEELIERRINRVTQLALAGIVFPFVITGALDLWAWRAGSPIPVGVSYAAVAVMILALGICSYFIARVKGQGGWQSVVWAIVGTTGTGLLALLLCANYYPLNDRADFPIYRGRKIRFRCDSCGRALYDYKCNAGTEGQCSQCGKTQVIPGR